MGRVKLNIDAGQFTDVMSTCLGMVLRDDTGCFLIGRTLYFPGNYRSEEAEVIGLNEALSWIKNLGKDNVEVEMDTMVVVDAVNTMITT
ncbi:hypothetical protein ACS0TY_033143 [Phlomoides rotata]